MWNLLNKPLLFIKQRLAYKLSSTMQASWRVKFYPFLCKYCWKSQFKGSCNLRTFKTHYNTILTTQWFSLKIPNIGDPQTMSSVLFNFSSPPFWRVIYVVGGLLCFTYLIGMLCGYICNGWKKKNKGKTIWLKVAPICCWHSAMHSHAHKNYLGLP